MKLEVLSFMHHCVRKRVECGTGLDLKCITIHEHSSRTRPETLVDSSIASHLTSSSTNSNLSTLLPCQPLNPKPPLPRHVDTMSQTHLFILEQGTADDRRRPQQSNRTYIYVFRRWHSRTKPRIRPQCDSGRHSHIGPQIRGLDEYGVYKCGRLDEYW